MTTAPRLTRSRSDRWISGVCGGLAARYGWDPTLVRVLVLVLTLVGFGSVAVAYLVMWLVVPQDDVVIPARPPGPPPPTA